MKPMSVDAARAGSADAARPVRRSSYGHEGARGPDRRPGDPRRAQETLRGVVLQKVEPGSVASTDELVSYGLLAGDGFIHGVVKHSAKEWTLYNYRTGEFHGTQHVESFWKLFGSRNSRPHLRQALA